MSALAGGNIIIPDRTELASAVYAIVFSKPVLKDVVIELQHCIDLDGHIPKEVVAFASAHPISSDVGYKFNLIDDGLLTLGNAYGSINVSKTASYCILFKNDVRGFPLENILRGGKVRSSRDTGELTDDNGGNGNNNEANGKPSENLENHHVDEEQDMDSIEEEEGGGGGGDGGRDGKDRGSSNEDKTSEESTSSEDEKERSSNDETSEGEIEVKQKKYETRKSTDNVSNESEIESKLKNKDVTIQKDHSSTKPEIGSQHMLSVNSGTYTSISYLTLLKTFLDIGISPFRYYGKVFYEKPETKITRNVKFMVAKHLEVLHTVRQ